MRVSVNTSSLQFDAQQQPVLRDSMLNAILRCSVKKATVRRKALTPGEFIWSVFGKRLGQDVSKYITEFLPVHLKCALHLVPDATYATKYALTLPSRDPHFYFEHAPVLEELLRMEHELVVGDLAHVLEQSIVTENVLAISHCVGIVEKRTSLYCSSKKCARDWHWGCPMWIEESTTGIFARIFDFAPLELIRRFCMCSHIRHATPGPRYYDDEAAQYAMLDDVFERVVRRNDAALLDWVRNSSEFFEFVYA